MSNNLRTGITNFEEQKGLYFVYDEVEVDLSEPEVEDIDETATLTDEFDVPEGFALDGEELRTWYLSGSDVIVFNVDLTNVIGECGSAYCLNNTARLVVDGSDVEHEDEANVVIAMPECVPCGGCIFTIGKRKN